LALAAEDPAGETTDYSASNEGHEAVLSVMHAKAHDWACQVNV
jgi:hypothetical protein